MDSSKFIKRIRAIQDEAKAELITYLKANSTDACVEIPNDVDIFDWAVDCKDWDDCNIFVTGIRLNNDCELEFKAEYAESEREYGNDGWDSLFCDNILKVNIGIETLFAFVVDTIARKALSGHDTITINNFREFLFKMRPSAIVYLEGEKYQYCINSIRESQEGHVILSDISDKTQSVSELLEQLNAYEGDKPVYLNDEDDNIIYGISTTYRDAGKEIYVQLI